MEKAKAEQVDYGGSGNYALLFFYFPPQLEPNKLDRSCAAREARSGIANINDDSR